MFSSPAIRERLKKEIYETKQNCTTEELLHTLQQSKYFNNFQKSIHIIKSSPTSSSTTTATTEGGAGEAGEAGGIDEVEGQIGQRQQIDYSQEDHGMSVKVLNKQEEEKDQNRLIPSLETIKVDQIRKTTNQLQKSLMDQFNFIHNEYQDTKIQFMKIKNLQNKKKLKQNKMKEEKQKEEPFKQRKKEEEEEQSANKLKQRKKKVGEQKENKNISKATKQTPPPSSNSILSIYLLYIPTWILLIISLISSISIITINHTIFHYYKFHCVWTLSGKQKKKEAKRGEERGREGERETCI
jgi:hypothetical protein